VSDDHGLEFRPDAIGHLLSDLKFKVPPHQRSYKWERSEQVKQLFDDVQDAMDSSGDGLYFLGMLVLMRGANPRDRCEVIDGQQRLATVSIFMAAVRDYFEERNDDRAGDIATKYLAERDTRSRVLDANLLLNVEDNKFFDSHVIKGNPLPPRDKIESTSNRRIAEAMQEARDRVRKIASLGAAETAGDRLLDWVDYFQDRARIVAIIVSAEHNAYTLFETLNDRGLDLTRADLIKNHLFSRAGDKLDHVRQEWATMSGTLEAAGDEDVTVEFIRHYWMSKFEPVTTKKLYDVFKKKTHAKTAAYDAVHDLAINSKYYAALLNPEAKLWEQYGDTVRDHVTAIRQMGIAVIRPLALAVLRRFPDKEVKTSFRLFVNWSVRLLIAGGHKGGSIESAYSARAIAVESGRLKTAAQLAKDMADIVPTDDVFRSAFASAHVTKANLARYYLRAIEDMLASEPHPELIAQPNAEKVNLEHVLPQNPSSQWNVDSREAGDLYNRIGNLAILPASVNVEIGNEGFDVKKKAFARSAYKFTSMIADRKSWTEDEINDRQCKLAEEAVRTWPLKFW